MKYTLIPGQPHITSEEETMSMIRSVLTEGGETPTAQRQSDSAKARVVPTDGADTETGVRADALTVFTENTTQPAPRRRALDLPDLASQDTPVQKKDFFGAPRGLMSGLRGFQPKTRHLALASAALLFVLRPHWFAIGGGIALALITGTFLTLGADRIWTAVSNRLARIEATDKLRAETLRAKLDVLAYRWDSVLDLFPDGMVDGLYMPDFQTLRMTEVEHQEVVAERLHRMTQDA